MKKLFLAAGLAAAALVLVKLAVVHSTMDTAFVKPEASGQQTAANTGNVAMATFAGGCFWCIESTFEKLEGVTNAISGYSGGTTENPTYDDVGGGRTGHTEAVQIYYDPDIISYEALLHRFWRDIDPTDAYGQFADRGSEYRPAIFYHDESQRLAAIKSRDDLGVSGRFNKPIAVEITALDKFWEAEGYHQDYYKKSPLRYKLYRSGSGRDAYLEQVWGDELEVAYVPESPTPEAAGTTYHKPQDTVLRNTLTDIQYDVTQNDATERPFQNAYWNNEEEGIYVDVVSGEPLFSSTTKYKSGTGWPSFWQPIDSQYIVEKEDFKLLFPRTEVRSKFGDSHLGHVFKDGPEPTGLRYCINSAALRFIPRGELIENGYGQYSNLFSQL